jgi:hypothetical protein
MAYYLEQAKAHAYYADGFGLEAKSKEFLARYEHVMWYVLFLAAEAGEI